MDPDPTIWQSTPPSINATTVTWQPAPKFRSTSNILISCLSTLFICVWSALHVDIPMPGTKWWQWRHHRSKFGWVFVGLFCPELLFWIAFTQFKTALFLTIKAHEYLHVADDVKDGEAVQRPELPSTYRRLAWILGLTTDGYTYSGLRRDVESSDGGPPEREDASTESPGSPSAVPDPCQPVPGSPNAVRGLPHAVPTSSPQPIPVSKPVRRHRWTLAHGFYAAMGGFVLKDPYVPRAPDHYLPVWQKNGVLTTAGVLLLMELEPSLIPDLAYEDIADRGKADAIGKALLILQVLWFLITCILRRAQGLPLCLLEITTIAHAACTLLTYFLWWAKPKDVEHQTVIVGPHARALGAWMSMSSCPGRDLLGGFLSLSCDAEMDIKHVENKEHLFSQFIDRGGANTFAAKLKVWFIFDKTTMPWYLTLHFREFHDKALEGNNSLRWGLAHEASGRCRGVNWPQRGFVVPTASLQAYTNVPTFVYDVARTPSVHFGVVTFLMGSVYGLPHLLGFNVTFAIAMERTLWLVATVLVASMGVAVIAAEFVPWITLIFLEMLLCCWSRNDMAERWSSPTKALLRVVIAIVYVCSSGYLVVASFRQLFALSPRAFELPSWGRYWPHFS